MKRLLVLQQDIAKPILIQNCWRGQVPVAVAERLIHSPYHLAFEHTIAELIAAGGVLDNL